MPSNVKWSLQELHLLPDFQSIETDGNNAPYFKYIQVKQ